MLSIIALKIIVHQFVEFFFSCVLTGEPYSPSRVCLNIFEFLFRMCVPWMKDSNKENDLYFLPCEINSVTMKNSSIVTISGFC